MPHVASASHKTYRIYSIYWVYSIYPPRKKQHSLLVLPSVNAILNFATKFFEMLTKLHSEHPPQVFRVFQVFQLRFWTKKPPIFGPNPNKTHKLIGSSLRHIMPAANTQKGNSPTCLRTRYCPVCNSRSFFSTKRLFSKFHATKAIIPDSKKTVGFVVRYHLSNLW